MGKPWEDYKEQIHNLYITQNLPLKSVQEILKNEYGFDACKRAFQNQIEAWGFRKNVRSSEMQVYVQQKKLRISDSEIDLPDETKKIITPRKARRFEKRSESMGQPKSTSLDLDPNVLSAVHHHHHHHSALQSPAGYSQRMSSGHGYSGFPYAHDLTGAASMGGSSPYGSTSAHHPGMSNIPNECRSPYNGSFINPAITSVTTAGMYTPMLTSANEAPMFDLTDDFGLSNGGMYDLPSGVVKKNNESEWYMPLDEPTHHLPSSYSYTSSSPLEEELFTMCFNGTWKDIQLILQKGASPNATSHEGETALMCLVKGMHSALENSASMATHSAVRALLGYNKSLDILLRVGADPCQRNHMGESPLDFAMSKDHLNSPYYSEEIRKQWGYFVRQLSGATRNFSY